MHRAIINCEKCTAQFTLALGSTNAVACPACWEEITIFEDHGEGALLDQAINALRHLLSEKEQGRAVIPTVLEQRIATILGAV